MNLENDKSLSLNKKNDCIIFGSHVFLTLWFSLKINK